MMSRTARGATTPTGEAGAREPVRRRRRPRSLAVLLAVCFAVVLSAVPGTASAAGVTPFVDCYRTNSDGSLTVVLGYTNSGNGATVIPLGTRNQLYPSRLQGSQPTKYLPGTRRGVFSVRLTQDDAYSDPRWQLDGSTLDYSTASMDSASQCSAPTPLPALGNGAGIALVLAGGGALGVFFVRRLIRRAAAAT